MDYPIYSIFVYHTEYTILKYTGDSYEIIAAGMHHGKTGTQLANEYNLPLSECKLWEDMK